MDFHGDPTGYDLHLAMPVRDNGSKILTTTADPMMKSAL
jgi:hypothetical protein